MQLLQTIQADYEPGTYVLDGTLASGGSSLAISTSAHAIRVYDLHRTTFLFDLRQHTHRITDLVSSAAQPSTLFSSQEDSGVMISDLRQAKAAHFLNEMQNHGVTCNSISVSPSGLHLAIATDGDVHIVDTRMWQSVRHMEQIHIDEVTRVRYLEEAVLCSASEDQMVNFTTTAEVVEDDVLLQAINTGDVMTRMTCFPEHMCVAMVSSCENGYLCPLDLEQREVKVPRPNYNTYLVDWCVVGGQLTLVMGERDDDGNPTTLSVLPWMGTPTSSSSTSSTPVQLQAVHRDIGRVALGFGDRLITGGEDGLLAFWSANTTVQEQHTASISSSVRGGVKEHTTTSSNTAGGAAQAPHTQGGTVPWKAGGGGGRGPAKRGKPY